MNTTCEARNKLLGYAAGFFPMVGRALLPSRYPRVEKRKGAEASCVLSATYVARMLKTREQHYYEFLKPKTKPVVSTAEASEFEQLKALFESDRWPMAAAPHLICSDDDKEGKKNRAERILDYIVGDLEGKKFLDFGCGEGDTIGPARKRGARQAIGYDPFVNSEPNIVKYVYGEYDAILMYDVVDHLKRDTLHDVLKMAHRHLDRNGTIYLRCHPYMCATGAHTYKQKNKGFAHIVFKPEELSSLGLNPVHTIKILGNPIKFYEEAIKKSGLVIKNKNVIMESMPSFFKEEPLVWKRFSESGIEYHRYAEVRFIDFELSKGLA